MGGSFKADDRGVVKGIVMEFMQISMDGRRRGWRTHLKGEGGEGARARTEDKDEKGGGPKPRSLQIAGRITALAYKGTVTWF